MPGSRWGDNPDVPRGHDYDERFRRLVDAGMDVHGEAVLLAELTPGPRILDGGCGTGRVAIELARRGLDVIGVDLDPAMLAQARANAPELTWVQGDLATLSLDQRFDTVALAGNVLIFVAEGTEGDVVARCADRLDPGGLLVAGFQVRADGYGPDDLDAHASAAGLTLVDRWSTWAKAPWPARGDYQVSVHSRRPA